MRRLAFLTPLVALVLAANASALPSPVELTHGWQFRFDPHARGGLNKWRSGGPRGGWSHVEVPGVFDASLRPSTFHGTIGWYRLRFRAPATPRGFGWALSFGAVRRTAQVWLNGRWIGAHQDAYAPFTLPAAGLRPRKVNELVVRVVNRKHALPREGWWNWGGITRPVRLIPQGPVVLENVAVMPSLSCQAPESCTTPVVKVQGRLMGQMATRAPVNVRVTMRSPGGAVTAHTFSTRAPGRGRSRSVSFDFPLAGKPDLWAPGHPALYSTQVLTTVGGNPAQKDGFDTGVRALEVRSGLLYLNGRRVQLRGASIEEDVPGRGPALRPSDIAQIVGELKAVGANVTRAQYGLSDELMSALDRAGILLWNQAPVYHRDVELRHPDGRAAAMAQVRHSVLAARGHACLFANSVDNEPVSVPDHRPGTRQFLFRAGKIAKRLDPITPTAVDLAVKTNIPFQRTFTWFDLLGLNSYFGWYTGRATNSIANFSDWEPTLQAIRHSYPSQGLVVTEFGAEASFHGPVYQKGTYEFQSDYLSKSLDIIDHTPFLGGAIYWTLREFAVKPHWDGGASLPIAMRNSIHHKGLLSYDGTPKPAWTVAEQRFKAIPLYAP
ncbi:MAG TPA: glycoside hydrolase family 2 TIM barrel-domain containing protein [Thermoleophilaceae bacterium]